MTEAFFHHLPVLHVLLPLGTAVLLLWIGDEGGNEHGGHGHIRQQVARRVALGSVVLGLALAVLAVLQAATGELAVYRVGEWPAPFGIALVVDRLGAAMLLLTAVVALAALWYARCGWDSHGRHFHALFQFQLMGLNGAFVTGDLFNLFVFFEVLLIASYVLMTHGLGRERLRAGLHYVVLNLLASALFLIGVSLIYAQTGTLNLADLALRIPQVSGDEAALVKVGALLLLVVFGFKAALAPLSVWLPATYTAASAPVAALFAIMTKVGVYAIWRVHGVIFGESGGESAGLVAPLLLPLALASAVAGVLGAVSATTLPRLVAWLNVASVGTVLVALALFSDAAWGAALYYMVNSTLVVAALFLLAELLAAQRGRAGGHLAPAAPVVQPVLLGSLMLLSAASAAGLPPLPGFIGKLMLLEAAANHPAQWAVWGVVLLVGFLTLLGLARAGSILFWHVLPEPPEARSGSSPKLIAPTLVLLACTVAMSIAAEPLRLYATQTASQLRDVQTYAYAVLGEEAARKGTTRPYRFDAPAREGGP